MHRLKILEIVMLVIITMIFPLTAIANNLFYPPVIDGHIDFEGERFLVDAKSGNFMASKPMSMKKNFVIRSGDINPEKALNSFGPLKMFLVSDVEVGNDNNDSEVGKQAKNAVIRKIHNLGDLQGFVDIENIEDALDFVRFGSSVLTSGDFEVQMDEVFCIDNIDTENINDDVPWGTVEQCNSFGFAPPVIKMKRIKKKTFEFEITRIVYDNLNGTYSRVVEEVGQNGKWRIKKIEALFPLNDFNIVFLKH